MADGGTRSVLIYEPHRIGRTGLLIGFGGALVFLAIFIPEVLDASNLPPQQADTPQWALRAFAAAFLFAFAWNVYWFLIASATELRLDDGELHWRTAFRRGSMGVGEITKIRNRLGIMPTVYSETDSVGVFPAKGVYDFVDAITAERPELRPRRLGLLATTVQHSRRNALRRELRRNPGE